MFHKNYVYAHVDEFCSPLYIGVGVYGRAWEQKKRDSFHLKWLEEQSHNYVEIWNSGLSFDQAIILERGYIREYDPKFNIQERLK